MWENSGVAELFTNIVFASYRNTNYLTTYNLSGFYLTQGRQNKVGGMMEGNGVNICVCVSTQYLEGLGACLQEIFVF